MNDFLTLNVDNETVTFLADGINNRFNKASELA